MREITVALIGNPNVGKTTLLNLLAGTDLKVGNWPGVTVEKKEATIKYKDYLIHIVDLPGIYTLEPLSEAEEVAIEFLENENIDVILDVIDTQNFEKNFFLTTQLLEFEKPTVIVLNIYDEAERKGINVDIESLEEILNVKVVKTVARKGIGIEKVLDAIIEAYEKNLTPSIRYESKIEEAFSKLEKLLGKKLTKHQAIKILLTGTGDKELDKQIEKIRKELEKFYGEKIEDIIKDERFGFAHGVAKKIIKKEKEQKYDITEILDTFLLHKYIGLGLYIFIMFLLFKIAFDFSAPLMDWLDGFLINFVSPLIVNTLQTLHASQTLINFFTEAVIGGVGFVLTFVPLIFVLFFLMTFLEMSGYLPRIAVLMDRFMEKLGLHGSMVIPLMLGFGCNVPAIMATKAIEDKRDKFIVIMMIPFMSCPARLIVFAFFASVFFENPVLIIMGLYLLGIVVGFITAFFLKKTVFKGNLTHFALELPPYRIPTLKALISVTWIHTKGFIYRAGTIIFAISIVVWGLLNLPLGIKDQSQSYAAKIGQTLVPIFEPLGINDWRATASLIPAFLAREIALSSLGTMYYAEIKEETQTVPLDIKEQLIDQTKNLFISLKKAFLSIFSLKIKAFEIAKDEFETLRKVIKNHFTPLSALSYMILLLIYTSCIATVAVMMQELGKKYALLFLLYSFVLAWIIAFTVYNAGKIIM
ncbi:MAG: ferrous iron transport protein B [Aquificae bacterium]|nr:ferrous iron transport protein B [Aquificota bacterium]